MPSIHVDVEAAEWEPGSPIYGPDAIYQGKELVQLKVMSDRRKEGGGIVYLVKFEPPPGKVIKIVAVAQSDEHIFSLEGDRSTKSGRPLRFAGQYALNPKGQPTAPSSVSKPPAWSSIRESQTRSSQLASSIPSRQNHRGLEL